VAFNGDAWRYRVPSEPPPPLRAKEQLQRVILIASTASEKRC
ncbi:hypothetical protein NPIL_497961, partial [Nephila pilipes]